MKKVLTLSALLILAVSCGKENSGVSEKNGTAVAVSFNTSADQTKTYLDSDGASVNWTSGDAISIFAEGIDSPGEKFTTDDSGATACFSGTIPSEVYSAVSDYYALAPYNSTNNISWDSSTKTITTYLSNSQVAVAGSFPTTRLIMVAEFASDVYDKSASATFKNCCGLLKFSLSRSDVSSICFTSNSGVNLVGEVSIQFDSGDINVAAQTTKDRSSFTLAPASGCFSAGEYYYAIVLPGTHSSGLKIQLTLSGGEVITVDNSTSLEIKKGVKTNLGTIDAYAAPSALTAAVGENIVFTLPLSGTKNFWSGESGHSYDGTHPSYYMSFGTCNGTISSSTYSGPDSPITVLYSTDLTGTVNKANVTAATWTDITSNFTLDTDFSKALWSSQTNRYKDSNYTDSGEYCIDGMFSSASTAYIAFKYTMPGNGERLGVYLKNFAITYGDSRTSFYEMCADNLTVVNVSQCSTGFVWYETSSSTADQKVLRMANNKIYSDSSVSYGYAVAEITRAAVASDDAETTTANSLSYAWTTAGTYSAVFVIGNRTIRIPVTITE